MIKKIVFLWDSSVEPWHGDIETTKGFLTELHDKGITCELMDTKDMAEEVLEYWRKEALINFSVATPADSTAFRRFAIGSRKASPRTAGV